MASINFETVFKNIQQALEKAVNLQIVTYIGSVNPEITERTDSDGIPTGTLECKFNKLKKDENGFALTTQINIAEGDIINILPKLTEEDKWIREYHQEQAKAGQSIVRSNIDMLINVIKNINQLQK